MCTAYKHGFEISENISEILFRTAESYALLSFLLIVNKLPLKQFFTKHFRKIFKLDTIAAENSSPFSVYFNPL